MKLIHNDKHLKAWTHKIIRHMAQDAWRPDYIVGITRGGLVPAAMLSHYLDVPMHTLNISFGDSVGDTESNLWMAEDAFGYVSWDKTQWPALRKKILIVDDINDSGRTLHYIKQDWPSGCFPDDPAWADIWHHSVRFAVMVDNLSSGFQDVDYCGTEINKQETPCWVVFPWENWWEQ